MTDALDLWALRVIAGHRYAASATALGLIAFALLPDSLGRTVRAVCAWDVGTVAFLALVTGLLLLREGDDDAMARNAMAQQEGEWTVFAITLAGVAASFAALTRVLSLAKDMHGGAARELTVGAVALTLVLSWLVTHVVFALRYAHEFYERGLVSFPAE